MNGKSIQDLSFVDIAQIGQVSAIWWAANVCALVSHCPPVLFGWLLPALAS